MTALNGALVLIKAGDGGSPETFTTIGGLRASQMALNRQVMDCSSVESGAWKQLLSGAGMQSLHIAGSGIFTDAASEATVRAQAFLGAAGNYQLFFANGDYVSGAFIITQYDRAGNHDGAELYALALESAGDIVFHS